MAKAKSRAKKKAQPPLANTGYPQRELAPARRNLRQLRELKAVMRQTKHAVESLEVDQVNLARLLVSTTEFTVVDVNELGRLQARVNSSRSRARSSLDSVRLSATRLASEIP